MAKPRKKYSVQATNRGALRRVHDHGGKPERALYHVDLFAGCGGMSLGLTQAGLKGLLANEASKEACLTLEYNLQRFYHEPILQGDISIVLASAELKSYIAKWRGDFGADFEIDLVCGGPPCQGFSCMGRRRPQDNRNGLFREMKRVVDILRPRCILFENVEWIRFQHKTNRPEDFHINRAFSVEVEEAFNESYVVRSNILDAADFGVPQHRPRYILIGIRRDLVEACPGFVEVDFFPAPFGQQLTLDEAISDLDFPLEAHVEVERHKKEAKSDYQYWARARSGWEAGAPLENHVARRHAERTRARFQYMIEHGVCSDRLPQELSTRKYRQVLLHADMLAPAISTLPDDFIHYAAPRVLTVREMARLQSFPDDFIFKGPITVGGDRRRSVTPQYTQVGNAVPPLLAQALGRHLMELLNLAAFNGLLYL